MSLSNKLIFVTGGATGIGRCIAEHCSALGARVVVASRSASGTAGSGLEAWQADVSREEDVARCFQRIDEMPEPLHGVICAAGILGELGPMDLASPRDWWRVFEVNVLGTMLVAGAAVKRMKRSGGGRLVFFSGGGQGPQANRSAYASSKGAIWRLTESLAQEVRADRIFVNAVAPGAVNTKFLDDVLSAGPERAGAAEYAQALKQKESGGTPPQKAADLVSYLLGPQAIGLTGKILSAVWDPYLEFQDLERMSDSDIYTVRRVTDEKGGTRFS